MKTVLRNFLSILLLPFLVAVVTPYLLRAAFPSSIADVNDNLIVAWLFRPIGLLLIVSGFGLLGWCADLFISVGRGTLAPWDPTQYLVVMGPYRYVRNPMIIGVIMTLIGQALYWRSIATGIWSCAFIVINHIYFIWSEEPGLEKRFGENYRLYKQNVPRWVPRKTPWQNE